MILTYYKTNNIENFIFAYLEKNNKIINMYILYITIITINLL